ncbi:unnamed protein product [Coregonus sp. 'balchen']|nr:unnamed protein product [Coregonus sp. 'balchen']
MSTAKENPCRKFQANIFNKSKCQNCFKPRELHLLTDQDLNQAKPIYGGWLCLAPEGTDFDNPMQRSRHCSLMINRQTPFPGSRTL